jgi:hypothetical protein
VGEERFGVDIPPLFEGLDHLPVGDVPTVQMVLIVHHDVHGKDVKFEILFQARWEVRCAVADEADSFPGHTPFSLILNLRPSCDGISA